MKRYVFVLRLTEEQILDYYRGGIQHALARTATGQVIQFPASLLRQFVTADGIHGRFALTCDDANENSRLEKLE